MTRKTRRGRKKKNDQIVSINQDEVFDEFITMEILSRLPIKSLMRFKCICKRWQSIIRKDQFFIDLHLSQSITTTTTTTTLTSVIVVANPINKSSRMFLFSGDLLLPSNEEDRCVEVCSNIRLWEPPIPKKDPVSLCNSLNGLICFMETKRYCARVYNISTRESTPWIKSIIKQHEDKIAADAEEAFQDDDDFIGPESSYQELVFLKHAMGYDPATKQHKVVALWEFYRDGYPASVFFWEVMTVGHNSWRRIDGIDPYICEPLVIREYVYVNGCIYWLIDYRNDGYFFLSIVEFSVGSEKLRLIKDLERNSCGRHPFRTELLEVNGQLGVLTCNDGTRRSMRIRTLYDPDENLQDKKHNTTTNAGSRTYLWFEETIIITLPHIVEYNSIRHIPGTNLLIVRTTNDGFSIYHYSRKSKNYYGIKKINNEISSKLGDEDGSVFYYFGFDVFTPNLLLVN